MKDDAAQSSKVTHISPMLLVGDMGRTIAFYQDVLGFGVYLEAPKYSIVERDGRLIHLKLAWSEEVMAFAREHTEIYIQVSGIAALWEHVQTFADRFKVRALFDRDYGMTEFHIIDPNGCLIFVGEPTAEVKALSSPPDRTSLPSACHPA